MGRWRQSQHVALPTVGVGRGNPTATARTSCRKRQTSSCFFQNPAANCKCSLPAECLVANADRFSRQEMQFPGLGFAFIYLFKPQTHYPVGTGQSSTCPSPRRCPCSQGHLGRGDAEPFWSGVILHLPGQGKERSLFARELFEHQFCTDHWIFKNFL